MRHHNHRPGITLTESLVALFVAALGMMSLLTLFPLGALQIGQAIKDGRTSEASQQADNLMRWGSAKFRMDLSNHPIQRALDQGRYTKTFAVNTGSGTINTNAAWVSANSKQPSYPVFVDPQGYYSGVVWPTTSAPQNPAQISQAPPYFSNMNQRVYDQFYLPRETMYRVTTTTTATTFSQLLTNPESIRRFTMLQDDMTFDSLNRTGSPASSATASSAVVERGGRYNSLWVLQRLDNSQRNLVNMSVVVFDGRPPLYANPDRTTERMFPDPYVPQSQQGALVLTPGNTSITINYRDDARGHPKPVITKGRWLVDVTVGVTSTITNGVNLYKEPPQDPNDASINNFVPLRHANFYRVASVVEDTTTPYQLNIELETPIRRNDGRTTPYSGKMLLLTGTAEVFERPPLNLEAPPAGSVP